MQVRFTIFLALTGSLLLACSTPHAIIMENETITAGIEIQTHPWYNTQHHRPGGSGFRNIWAFDEKRSPIRSGLWITRRMLISHDLKPAPFQPLDADALARPPDSARITWIGHATCLVQIGSQAVLTDPIFSSRASPVPFAGPVRQQKVPISIEDLPRIDVVVISHSHYDHLDRPSIRALHRTHQPLFLVPLGVGELLLSWGVTRVVELDWWQYVEHNGIRYHATPARHWSTRSAFDRNRRLWASWYMEDAGGFRAYHAGDTAYAPHFSEIRERLGPPNVAMIPIGAYLPRWFMKSSHVDPAEALQAFLDLEAEHFIGIHWGIFDLSDEPLHVPGKITPEIAKEKGIPAEKVHILPVGGVLTL